MDQPIDRSGERELIHGLVSIPSLSRAEQAATAWLVAQMSQLGYDRAYVDEAGNAVGEVGAADATQTIVLLGHIDTVPGEIPVRIIDEGSGPLLYGRGSINAKGPLAAFVAAVAHSTYGLGTGEWCAFCCRRCGRRRSRYIQRGTLCPRSLRWTQ